MPSPNFAITKISAIPGGFLRVEAQDMALIPRTFHYDMTQDEIDAANLSEGLEIQVTLNGIWTVEGKAGKPKPKPFEAQ